MAALNTLNNHVRIVTAASLFDGHDAAINIMRRLLQAGGAEVIHLGHNRSAMDVAVAAVQEDAQAVAISSYQGGHMEYFKYLRTLLDDMGAPHVKVFGGGGGVIVADEIRELESSGVERIYSPEDGRRLGLEGMIADLLQRSDYAVVDSTPDIGSFDDMQALARAITVLESVADGQTEIPSGWREKLDEAPATIPVLGITGTGGAGKSSLTDELLRRWLMDHPKARVAVLSVDPTRRRSGGALLGDRIRMNALNPEQVFMRSLATRGQKGELSAALADAIAACRLSGVELVVVETSGIGQGDTDIADLASLSMYVMTPEYGAPSQLEKIDMLDYADLIAINKFEKRGALDALRDVRKQVRRNSLRWTDDDTALPVYGTVASRFADVGVTALYHALMDKLDGLTGKTTVRSLERSEGMHSLPKQAVIAPGRERYLADISLAVRGYHAFVAKQVELARRGHSLQIAAGEFEGESSALIQERADVLARELDPQSAQILKEWPGRVVEHQQDEFVYTVRGRDIRQPAVRESLSKTRIPRISLPQTTEPGAILQYSLLENTPGRFPYTAGVFPLKRLDEEPKRMFAGEGGPAKTNARFHYLCRGESVHRLSTAFDSVTLYGEDPAHRPDIFGKIGESGVSVPHVDDMKILYKGFDLCAPTTSVSMTINGPAPILLAMFFNTAIDQEMVKAEAAHGRALTEDEAAAVRQNAISVVRGTVQADILKEDQAQNTCIFSTPFALRMMGDIQSWFVDNTVRNFYSVSISGYHIAEAGANPISQLAFTLSNGFTIVENYLSRGMDIDDFAPNLSFFFSNGLDPEYTVIGRVARRIWAVAMRERYGASTRSQKLKYHIQTSGRSLHAREIQFNDIRTTLQALLAIADNCNSLHTNAYDEAITTPTEESVRRAMAIQMIVNREFGLAMNENPFQGSHFVEWLTDTVESAVLEEFDRIDSRGGVLGAMELQYQRMQIQEESLYYEHKKHDGSLPIVGINTFLDPNEGDDWTPPDVELRRADANEKQAQIASVERFHAAHADESEEALVRLKRVAVSGGNVFGELMSTVRVASLGQITHALYEVGGAYRRNL
jgi:methylmalonyl-CoA mutase